MLDYALFIFEPVHLILDQNMQFMRK